MFFARATALYVCLLAFGTTWAGSPLSLGQTIPNEPEEKSSGPISGKITRESNRFHKELVRSFNSDIRFKDEENTTADRYMTPRCREKLDNLARLVKRQWVGAKLMVLEAWDEGEEQHSDSSLHYEGRAVDVTTSEHDPAKLGMLGRLAVKAGFNWVSYTNPRFLHASVNKTNGTEGSEMYTRRRRCTTGDCRECEECDNCCSNNDCFTLDSRVKTPAGDSLLMNELKLGDHVMTMKTSGEISSSPIISFLHYEPERSSYFVRIETDDDYTITLTTCHLIYKTNHKIMNGLQLPEPVFASEVKEGHYLFVVPTDNATNILTSRVVKVRVVEEKGVIAPLTADGTIVVDNVVASCYAVTRRVGLAHLSFAPLRLLYHTVPRFLPDRVEGIPWYPRMLGKLAQTVGVIGGSSNIMGKEL